MENVKELWEEIKQRFSIRNGPRVQQLKSNLVNCKQEGQGIVVYYGRLKSLWDELNNYDSIPVCTCTGCKCNISTQLEKKRKEERVHQFLMGLDEDGYGTVCSNILSIEPLSNLNRVYAMIVQQERSDGKDKTLICSNCKRKGHEADSCFQRIGYLEWWDDKPRTTIGGHSGGRGCGVQQGTGGRRGRGGIARANAVQTSGTDGGRSVVTDFDRTGISGLSDEQWVTLLTMLNSHKGGANERLTAGEQREGIYFLMGMAPIRAYKTTSIASYELWHRRMGHPSSRVVDLIYEVDNVGRNDGVKNKTPSVLLDGKTPYEILYGQAPSYKHIQTLGCLCYAHDQNRDKDKFASRSRKYIFVGYPFGKKGWRLYDLESGKYFVSRDVIFVEAEFLYFNNVVDSSLTENRVVDFSTDDEDPYMQNDMEEQQASVSDIEHEIDVEMGHNMEMATDGNTEAGNRGALTCQDLWCLRNSLAREKGLSNLLFG
ncbi:hypothetical protein CK203_051204 [Vitis vinifera]|uniref:Retroviral polymerase SH3-like domain-containing protein n=1 Tax=Vitis vinifera TaxID=29760 RepID=A0A438HEH7_VITVI|nr:hypothetical protein CK203_051204 [Vitis vinifera]